MEDVYVKVIDFPTTKVKETVTANEDGSYTIFLNAKMSADQLEKAYFHALYHIKNKDFEKEDVQEIEYEAHRRKIL